MGKKMKMRTSANYFRLNLNLNLSGDVFYVQKFMKIDIDQVVVGASLLSYPSLQ